MLRVSEKTLLPVLIPARELGSLVPRLREAVGEVLQALKVPDAAIRDEQREMTSAVIGKTASRQVLGSMNDFVTMLEAYRGSITAAPVLLDLALRLAGTPCGPLRMNCPRDETVRVFGG